MSSKTESTDQLLTCVDCGQEFTWSAGEQDFFRDKGFTETPKRCKACRQAKKDKRGDSTNQDSFFHKEKNWKV